mgnify:CR=1 FL=1
MDRDEPVVAFDVGNTKTKCAIVGQGRPEIQFEVLTNPTGNLADRLETALETSPTETFRNLYAVASSVNPAANDPLADFWESATGNDMHFFGGDLTIPITQLTTEPERTGADRLLCALGSIKLAGSPCIVVMAGTAITVDLVDARGCFVGGAIAPGFHLCARVMSEGTALLPEVTPAAAPSAVGRSTESAIESGIRHFCVGGVRLLLEEYSRLVPENPAVVMTGGDSGRLMSMETNLEVHREPALIFIGMREALRRVGRFQ